MKFIDTHCHINLSFYSEKEIKEEIKNAFSKSVDKIIIPSTSKKDFYQSLKICKDYEGIYLSLGIHPSNAFFKNIFNFDDELIKNNKEIVAIGECGIDLYYENNPSLEIQKKVFIDHIKFAKKHKKPVIVHMRDSQKEIFEIISKKEYEKIIFILHSYSGNEFWTKKFLLMKNVYFSFSGVITFKNASIVQENCKIIPIERILCETDSPYLTPHPFRGKKNSPSNVILIVKKIANIKNKSEKVIAKELYRNALKVFKI